MAQNSAPVKKDRQAGKARTNDPTPAFFSQLTDITATLYLVITAVVLPLYMNQEKYTAITAAKSGFFFTSSIIVFMCITLLLTSSLLYSADSRPLNAPRKSFKLRQRISESPTLIADAALIAYWFFMLISCLLATDRHTAFYGLEPRDNGFIYQTVYIIAYFVISRLMKPAKWKAEIFVWGGALLSIPCIFHYYGVDFYDVVHYSSYKNGKLVDGVLSSSYSGPFWDSSSYRFMGPVGNVNLGSYILCITLVIAAGLYISGDKPDIPYFRSRYSEPDKKGKRTQRSIVGTVSDKYGISLLVCFVMILFAELNINTDAGLVALAAAVAVTPIVLCSSAERLSRALTVLALSSATVLLDNIIDTALRKEQYGTTFKLLCMITVVLGIAAVAGHFIRNKEAVRRFASPARLRTVLTCLIVLAVIGGIAASLIATEPDEPAAGAISGATETLSELDLEEKSDSILHELGQMLRGNFDDSFGHNRLFTWKRTLSLVKHNPVFGIGPDNFPKFFASYYKEEAQKMFPDSNGNLDKAHNEFLDVLLDNGIVGLVTYLCFFGALLHACFRKSSSRLFAPVLGVAVVSYMAHAFFGYQLPIQSPVMWIMIGAAGAFARGENVAEPTSIQAR